MKRNWFPSFMLTVVALGLWTLVIVSLIGNEYGIAFLVAAFTLVCLIFNPLFAADVGIGTVETRQNRFISGVLYTKIASVPRGKKFLVLVACRRGTYAVEMDQDPPEKFSVIDDDIRPVS